MYTSNNAITHERPAIAAEPSRDIVCVGEMRVSRRFKEVFAKTGRPLHDIVRDLRKCAERGRGG